MNLKNKLSSQINFEYILLLCVVASMLISCALISEKKYFWNDELYSYYLLADHSFSHMLVAFHDKINNTPFLYFLTGWFWAKMFGSTELSLRLFSSLGFCIALVITWKTLRQRYNFVSTSLGVLVVFCTSDLILDQNAEARMYGLFLAFCSLGLFQYDLLNRKYDLSNGDLRGGVTLKNLKRSLYFNTFIHIAIVHTHLFGIFYSGAILLAQFLKDRYFKLFQPKIYLSIILAWCSLLLYLPSFLNQVSAGYPRSWIPIPTWQDLLSLLNAPSPVFMGLSILTLVMVWIGLEVLVFHDGEPSFVQLTPESRKSESALSIIAYSFLAVPVFVWFLSKTIKPIFIDRYMLPSMLSWAILFAFFFSRTIFVEHFNLLRLDRFRFLSKASKSHILALLFLPILLFYPLKNAADFPREPMPGLNDVKYGYNDLPIITQFSHDFTKRFHYSPQRSRYFFILDWEAALDENSGLFTPQEYKHLDALKRNYPQYFSNHIIQSADFLAMNRRFLVLDSLKYDKKCGLERSWENISCPQWLEKRILSDSSYRVKTLGQIDTDKTILLVEK